MKSCSTNDVKVYNLSAGKSLPEWISEQKRRNLQKTDVGVRRRVELLQDFDMPGVSSNIQVSPDGNYILATGIYKPRVRCYDVKNFSMKFERCFDSEVVRFLILSEDYSKLVFLQCDRYVEFHSQAGRYFRLRIPKFGRDLAYHPSNCDLYLCGASSEVYRLNLELGRFMTPWETTASGINRIDVNPVHHLVALGTEEGRVDAWDPRAGSKAATLDVGLDSVTELTDVSGVPSVTSLKFKDGLMLGVGTATGQTLLYDIRSSKPLLVKDHYYALPIKGIQFHPEENLVLSMDSKIIKIWHENTGEPFTAVEGEAHFNDLCLVPKTGMFFAANEDKKMLSYYVPSMGPAPKWCAFLDNITEELEESDVLAVYDDYKFVTEKELHEIGLGHLIGTNLLRAYMHGFFMDMRLYRKAKAVVQPFQFDEFKKQKIRERLREQRVRKLNIGALPPVNKELALKCMDHSSDKTGTLIQDDRFKALFHNPDFEIDKSAVEYRFINPVISKLDKKNSAKLQSVFNAVPNDQDEEMEGQNSSEEDSNSDSDEDAPPKKKPAPYKKKSGETQPKLYELKTGEDFKLSALHNRVRPMKTSRSLGDRLDEEIVSNETIVSKGGLGSREMTFTMRTKKRNDARVQSAEHRQERKQLSRRVGNLKNKKNSWKG